MNISKRGEYAIRTLIDLGIAQAAGRPLLKVSELARREQLPAKFLEQIMNDLREGGFVKSERGKYGGYRLNQPAKAITVGAVLRAVEGPLAPIGCVSQSSYSRCTCPDEAHCGLRMLMIDVHGAISGILDRYTLADVVGITVEKLRRHGRPLPFSAEADRLEQAAPSRVRPPKVKPGFDEAAGFLHRLLGEYSI